MRLNSIRLKIVMAFVAGTLLSVLLVVLVAAFVLQTNVLARTDLSDMAHDLSAKVYVGRDGRLRLGTEDHHAIKWAFDSLGREIAYRVVDRAGNAALLSEAGSRFWPDGVPPPGAGRDRFEFSRDGVTFFGASEPLALEGRHGLYLQVAASSAMTIDTPAAPGRPAAGGLRHRPVHHGAAGRLRLVHLGHLALYLEAAAGRVRVGGRHFAAVDARAPAR